MTDQDPWIEQFEARRKEREQADRSFTLLGETLVVKPNVAPEVAFRRSQFDARVAAFKEAYDEAEKAGKETPVLGVDDEEFLELSQSIIVDCLEPESLPAWNRLRSPEHPDPLSLLDIYGLSGYILARVTRLPTAESTDSSGGLKNGRASSKAASPSRVAVRKR
jgi:hypothetical protein